MQVQAASSRDKAYAAHLAKNPAKPVAQEAGYRPKNKKYINSYSIYDIDGNKTKELITYTQLNFRYTIIRIYSYSRGKVKPYKFSNGKNAVLHLNSEANGTCRIEVCKKNHLHQMWSGGIYGTTETVYQTKGNKLKRYLDYSNDTYTGRERAKRYNKKITVQEYKNLTKSCTRQDLKIIKNTKSNRNKLRE